MASFDRDGVEYNVEGEMLTEVEVDENPPDTDDEESIWTDDGDDMEENMEEEEAQAKSTRFLGPVDDMAVCAFDGHTDSVYCTAIHPTKKGTIITGGGDDKSFIWQYSDSGEIEHALELTGHTDTVSSVGFNYDGTLALTGSYDGTVRIWKVETGEAVVSLDGPEDIEFAEWHPRGNAVVAGSKDGTVWMWLVHNGQCVQVFAGHDGGVTCGCFTKDGNTVCSGGEDGTVRVWAPKTGKCKHVFEGHTGHEGMVTCMAGSNDGDLIITGSVDGRVLLLSVSRKKVLQTFVHSRPKVVQEEGGGPTPSTVPALEKDDDEDSFGGFDQGDEDEDAEGTLSVECVGFSNGDFRWGASGGLDKTLKVWDIVTGTCRAICPHGDSVVALKWHSSLPIVSTAALDHIVRVWDARSGILLLQLTGHRDLVTNLDFISIPQSSLSTASSTASATASISNAADSIVVDNTEENVNNVEGEINTKSIVKIEGMTDMIVSVSDDQTARVFYLDPFSLLT
mmetsp:Transcript_25828/g.24661  ORF Transcript_25828/g.24661 Transcript_25828/m.24661 type:complete len:508 (-) Transcript_25828:243-1766(-)|eukprot:CAMPEP_0119034952 /NCGR_PEP_ID=MMETSP1177-20130426/1959_1 /TAXON_ID=2985 /ORGANISM="Ochromonas sp, Strain CCMP1899" /LENGTH=507 /DNA_ID=CAMNT_0006992795 /DNA_START=164 /DNA_END=1687 /DNA_ORIENTATION=+